MDLLIAADSVSNKGGGLHGISVSALSPLADRTLYSIDDKFPEMHDRFTTDQLRNLQRYSRKLFWLCIRDNK